MLCTLNDLCQKEIINIDTAERLGYVTDVEIDSDTGEMINICVSFGSGLFKRNNTVRIAKQDIVKIGAETVLVKNVPSSVPAAGKKLSGLFSK